jgi:hypothetical protein
MLVSTKSGTISAIFRKLLINYLIGYSVPSTVDLHAGLTQLLQPENNPDEALSRPVFSKI